MTNIEAKDIALRFSQYVRTRETDRLTSAITQSEIGVVPVVYHPDLEAEWAAFEKDGNLD